MDKRRQLQALLILLTCVLLAAVWANEYLDFTGIIFHTTPSPPDVLEALFESLLILILACISIIVLFRAERTIIQTQEEKEVAKSDSLLHEKQFRKILRDAPFLIIVINRDYTIQYINRAFENLIKIPKAEITGQSLLSLIDSDFKIQVRESFRKIFENETLILQSDNTYLDTEGNKIPVRETLSGIIGKNSEPTQLLIMGEDRKVHQIIAKQRNQSQKLDFIEKETKGFVHHYNNQLMVIMGTATLLAERNQDTENLEYIETIRRTADSAIELTKSLLSSSRNGSFSIKTTDINSLIRKIEPEVRECMENIPVNYKLCPEPLKIKSHGNLLENALLNIILNAREAMGHSGELIIQTGKVTENGKEPIQSAEIQIKDRGPGISSDIIDKIFEPFFTTKPDGTGAGLGLAAVNGAIQSHKGHVKVENLPEGGACFILTIPLVKSGIGKSEEKVIGNRITDKKVRLLLVDDEEGVRKVTGRLLTSMGYEVLEASSGQEAVDIYKEFSMSIDGVLLDMIMPEMDGLYTFNEMKNINSNIKAILLSGYSMEDKAAELLKTGISDYIMKPVSKKELADKVYQYFIIS